MNTTLMDGPTHLLAFAGDRRTLCNRKTRDTRNVIVARFVGRHERSGDQLMLCDECKSVAHDHNVALDVAEG